MTCERKDTLSRTTVDERRILLDMVKPYPFCDEISSLKLIYLSEFEVVSYETQFKGSYFDIRESPCNCSKNY